MYKEENVDQAEVAKFASLAADWWNPFGNCKPLHDINPLRLEFIQKYSVLTGMHILDVGCGGGILAESLAKCGSHVVGIDISAEAINVAKIHGQPLGLEINYHISTAEDFALQHEGRFDIVTCMELLEHVPNPASVIAACAKILRPDGHAFFSTINRNPKAYFHAIIGAEYLLKLLPKGTHHYAKFIRPIEMFNMLQQQDLQLANMAGIHYHPISKSYTLVTDVSVNYLVHCYKGTCSSS